MKTMTIETATLKILNDVVRRSYEDRNHQDTLEYFNNVKNMIPAGYEYLLDAVLTHLFWAKDCARRFEKHIQEEFFSNLNIYMPGAVKVEIKMNSLHVPDGFVKYNGDILPVEVKLDSIVSSSIRQITRYIKEYGSVGGVVVAPSLHAPLPNNVIFIQVSKKQTHKITTVQTSDGREKVVEQVLVTPKGLARLAKVFEARP